MSEPAHCPNCASVDLLVVQLSPSGTPMRFHTCRHCEHRWWEDLTVGSDIGLNAVLANISG